MPAIIVDSNKGLFQKAATSQNPAGTLAGAKRVVLTDVGSEAEKLFTEADSGALVILGSGQGASTVKLPAPTGKLAGWNIQCIQTGSRDGSIAFLKGGDTTVLVNGLLQCDDGSAAGDVTTTANTNTSKQQKYQQQQQQQQQQTDLSHDTTAKTKKHHKVGRQKKRIFAVLSVKRTLFCSSFEVCK